jgi:hypothetical protein
MARNYGFMSAQEFMDYECPGAYQVPKNANVLYATEWQGWEDFLGIPWDYETSRSVVRALGLTSAAEYAQFYQIHVTGAKTKWNNKNPAKESKLEDPLLSQVADGFNEAYADENHPIHRLPYRPDLYYRNEFVNWQSFLGME